MHGKILSAAYTEITSRWWKIICSKHVEDSLIGTNEWEKVCNLLVSLSLTHLYNLTSFTHFPIQIVCCENWNIPKLTLAKLSYLS
jgi:hypothetical protein